MSEPLQKPICPKCSQQVESSLADEGQMGEAVYDCPCGYHVIVMLDGRTYSLMNLIAYNRICFTDDGVSVETIGGLHLGH